MQAYLLYRGNVYIYKPGKIIASRMKQYAYLYERRAQNWITSVSTKNNVNDERCVTLIVRTMMRFLRRCVDVAWRFT